MRKPRFYILEGRGVKLYLVQVIKHVYKFSNSHRKCNKSRHVREVKSGRGGMILKQDLIMNPDGQGTVC